MSLATHRTPLQRADDLARALMRDLIPACRKIAVAGRPIDTPEEEDVFRVLGVPYLEPSQRR